MLNDLAYSDLEDLSDELDVPCRYVRIKSEENGQFVWKMQKVPAYATVEAMQTRTQLDLISALKSGLRHSRAELRKKRNEVERPVAGQRGNRRNTQKVKERGCERITAAVSEGERDKNIQLEQRAWEKR